MTATQIDKANRFKALHQGPGAFVIAIDDFSSFAYAIVNKLIKEIAGEVPPTNLAAGHP